jgi:protein TonB
VSCIDPRAIVIASCTAALLGACASPRAPSGPGPGPGSGAPSAASARSWDAYRAEFGRRLVAANPNGTYTGPVPEPLLAIPVLEIDLHRDGSVRNIQVQRPPSQAPETVQMAIDAVRRAAPFGDVSHLPQPWRVSEVFLFREDRRFKPRSLD